MKKIVTLLLALLLCAMLALPAFADAWIPPTDDGQWNKALTSLPEDGNTCEPLNRFLSRFAETNLTDFREESSEQEAIRAVLKDLELHPDDSTVVCETDGAGVTYLRIPGEAFESRALTVLDRELHAEDCPGYRDGDIYVTADSFDAPPKVFAHAVWCEYIADGTYYVYFEVYAAEDSVEDCYTLSYPADAEGIRQLGTGTATFLYAGDPETTVFESNDFQLDTFHMEAEDIPYTDENLPYSPAEKATESSTTEPVVLPTESTRQDEPTAAAAETGTSGKLLTILLVVALVVAAAAVVLVIILLKWRKKP